MSVLRKLAKQTVAFVLKSIEVLSTQLRHAMSKYASMLFGHRSQATKRQGLIQALKKGERSGFVAHFDRDEFLKSIHRRSKAFGIGTTATMENERQANFTGK